jgi:TPR repeat protein
MLKLAGIILLVILLPSAASAVSLEGRLAYRRGDFATVMREVDSGAQSEPLDAFFLALMYFRGDGVARDEARGLKLLKYSADEGYFAAQYLLGQRYLYGSGVPKDRAQAMSYLLAASAGDDYRAVVLLKILEKGSKGEKKDRENVTSAVKRQARSGIPAAQFTLAFMYLVGDGVPKDGVEEVRWYRAASTQHARAAFILSLMYQAGEGVPQNPGESFRLMRIAAEKKDVRAQYFLGTFYYQGIGTPVDHQAAGIWFRKASENGFDDAQLAYGMLLLSGDGVPVDKSQAIEWLGRAARQDNVRAKEVLKELLTYRGQSYVPSITDSSLYALSQKKQQNESQLRLEGKGVVLDQGSFGLKFSLPTLYDAYAPRNEVSVQPVWEKLQGGTFDIIFRPFR